MVPIMAIALGGLAVGYAVWPFFRGASPGPLGGPADRLPEEIEAEVTALRGWSVAAGELQRRADSSGGDMA